MRLCTLSYLHRPGKPVRKHQRSYVLIWEVCPKGLHYDESSYARDERHLLAGVDEVIRLLTENGLTVAAFRS